MPSDSELRSRFLEGTQPKGQIDVDAVLRRARARRRPRVIAASAGSVLAIAAIAVPATLSSFAGQGAGTDTLVAVDGEAPESATGGAADNAIVAPAEKLNLCAAPVAELPPAANGLVLSAAPVTAQASEESIPVVVTLTNTGSDPIFGTTASEPAITLAQDGVTLWHSNGPRDLAARIVDLGPGESMTYQASFEPVVCAPEDDARESFRTGLPPAGPGRYELSAAIDVVHDDGSAVVLVGGPPASVTLG